MLRGIEWHRMLGGTGHWVAQCAGGHRTQWHRTLGAQGPGCYRALGNTGCWGAQDAGGIGHCVSQGFGWHRTLGGTGHGGTGCWGHGALTGKALWVAVGDVGRVGPGAGLGTEDR